MPTWTYLLSSIYILLRKCPSPIVINKKVIFLSSCFRWLVSSQWDSRRLVRWTAWSLSIPTWASIFQVPRTYEPPWTTAPFWVAPYSKHNPWGWAGFGFTQNVLGLDQSKHYGLCMFSQLSWEYLVTLLSNLTVSDSRTLSILAGCYKYYFS